MEEIQIAAMRGRNPDDPNDRGRSNGKFKQRLEINRNGTSNTITSVQKDNLVVEPQIIQLGNIADDTNKGFKNPQTGRVYSDKGLVPCLNTCGGGGREPKVLLETPNGVQPCLEFTNFISKGQQNNSYNRVWKPNGYCGALNCTKQMEVMEPKEHLTDRKYRIRKLTPRECFRLMGVDDTDIDAVQQAGISNSQQYKLAGNSIVVDVLYHIFRKAFCKEPQPLYCVKLTNNMTSREPKSTVVALKLNYERKETIRLTNDAFYYLLEGEEPLDEDNLAEALHLTSLHPNGFQINDGWTVVEGSDLIECEIIPYEVEEEEICDYDEYLEVAKNCHLRIKHVNDNKVRLWKYDVETDKQEYIGEFQLHTNKFGLVCFQTGPQNEEFRPGKACLYFLKNFKKK